jgi:hypothetical protein
MPRLLAAFSRIHNTLHCHRPAAQDDVRESTPGELHFEDLDKLGADELARMAEWLTEKVDALSTRLKVEQREDEVCVCVHIYMYMYTYLEEQAARRQQ